MCLLTLNAVGQEEQKMDSLTTDIIQNIYKENPESISNSDSVSNKHSSLKAYPYAFYTPESKVAFGAGGIYIFYTGQSKELKPSKIGFGGYYSTNNQYKISMNNVFYFLDNKLYFHLPLSYGYFVNKYWGIGDDTPEYDFADYAMQTFSATLTAQVPPEWFSADRTGIILDYDYTDIADKKNNILLQDDSLAGANGGILIGI